MFVLERLDRRHEAAVLRFEQENRAFFARSVRDRGDDYFAQFPQRHALLLAEQEAGICQFHVLVAADGTVVGRFNLMDLAGGEAELGYRMAEKATGQGLAKAGVREVCERARQTYGLRRLSATASPDNPASLAVLRATGFTLSGPVALGLLHHRDLAAQA